VSGADPLNLVGIVVPGPRVPALASNRVLYRDGAAAGVLISAEPRILEQVPSPQLWELTNLLMRSHAPASLARLLH
jgi:ATP-dependent Lhr-like helicase